MYNDDAMRLSLVSSVRFCDFARIFGAGLMVACLAPAARPRAARGASPNAAPTRSAQPYKIDGVTYTPKEDFNHVETGVASWYGPGFHGKSTANGERYDQTDRTAAHRTLQMPSIVRVTNLSNGLSTVVRINDRGPFASNRVIDLSRTAAQELDVVRNGTARVRIEQLQAESLAVKDVAINGGGPAEQNEALAQLASGKQAPQQPQQVMATAQPAAAAPAARFKRDGRPSAQPCRRAGTDAAPSGKAGPTIATLASAPPAASSGGFYVQTGSFSTAENAERQRGAGAQLRLFGDFPGLGQRTRRLSRQAGALYDPDAAGIVADRLKRSGYGDARVVGD